jgi:2-dehydropantoate 2-reductase
MKIAVIGAGALGLYYGAMLQKGGNDVHFLLRSDYEAIRQNGLTVFSINGNFHLPRLQVYRSPEQIGISDLVIVGLKTFSNYSFTSLISPLVGIDTTILTLQNGLGNEEELAIRFGREKVMGGVAFLCSNRGEPGTVHHLGAGRIIMGEFVGPGMERAEKIARIFADSDVECKATGDLARARWEKLVWNIPFNGICALLQKPVDYLLADTRLRKLVKDIMLEVIAGANSQNISQCLPESFADAMITFTEGMGAYRPSMMIDRELNRPLELDAIYAVPLERAMAGGICMSRIEELLALLAAGEKRSRLHVVLKK